MRTASLAKLIGLCLVAGLLVAGMAIPVVGAIGLVSNRMSDHVAATSLKGTGLVDAFEAALEHVFEDGTYEETLDRWGLSGEAVDAPEVNPAVAS